MKIFVEPSGFTIQLVISDVRGISRARSKIKNLSVAISVDGLQPEQAAVVEYEFFGAVLR